VFSKAGNFIEAHPKIMVALCGAAVALQMFEIFETMGIFTSAFRDAHQAEIASDAARAASEALGG
jgi:hypothetical protein